MNSEETYILINVALYVLSLIYYQRKNKRIEIGTVLLSIFALSSVCSFFYFSIPIVQLIYYNISLLPFLYLFGAIMFTLSPILRYKSSDIKQISSTGQETFIRIISILIIIMSVDSCLENLMGVFQTGFNTAGSSYGSIYDGEIDNAKHLSFIGRKTNYIVLLLTPLNISIFYYYLSKKNLKYALYMLLPILSVFLWGIASASRGSLISNFLLFVASYFIFQSILPSAYKKRIKQFLPISVAVMSLFVLVITFSRFNNNATSMYDNPFEWLLLYLGESFLRFNQIAWNNDFFMWGDNSFASIKDFLGIYPFESRLDCTNYYDIKIGSQVETFYTYIGDYVLDFGIYISIVVYIVLYWLLKNIFTNRSKLPFEYIPLMIALLKMFLTGFTANIYRGGVSMLVISIVYFLIGRMLRKQNVKNIT